MTFCASLRSYAFLKDVMIIALVMNIINIFINFILINGMFGFQPMGVQGAAISTNISKIFGLALAVYYFFKKTNLKLSLIKVPKDLIYNAKELLHIAVPSAGEQLSYHISQIVIMSFINTLGAFVITTKVYCSMFANVAYIYSIAISQASQIVASYLIGANFLKIAAKKVYSTKYS